MSFIKRNATSGKVYAPGYFLADNEGATLVTFEADAENAQVVTDGTAKYIPMGTIYPANGSTAVGIVYEDVDVSEGNMPGSLVKAGVVYENRLPDELDSDAKTALQGLGFVFLTEGTVTRPDYDAPELEEIEVTSVAGTASGDTKITIDYTLGTGESLVYKVDTTAPTIDYGEVPDFSWTAWDGSADITAATGKKIAIVAVDSDSKAIAYGNATVTAKA